MVVLRRVTSNRSRSEPLAVSFSALILLISVALECSVKCFFQTCRAVVHSEHLLNNCITTSHLRKASENHMGSLLQTPYPPVQYFMKFPFACGKKPSVFAENRRVIHSKCSRP